MAENVVLVPIPITPAASTNVNNTRIKRKVTISKTNVKKLTKPAVKTGKMIETIKELFEEDARNMEEVAQDCDDVKLPNRINDIPTVQVTNDFFVNVTPVLQDDRGQICPSDLDMITQMARKNQPVITYEISENEWTAIEASAQDNTATTMCDQNEFAPVMSFDEKDNPFVQIIMRNLPSLKCPKCANPESAINNHGRDKCGTIRLKCNKCTSTGSIRAYANAIPVAVVRAVVTGLSGLPEMKKALGWCNLLQGPAEADLAEEGEIAFVEEAVDEATLIAKNEKIKVLERELSLANLEIAALRAENARFKNAPVGVNTKRTFIQAAMNPPPITANPAKTFTVRKYDSKLKLITNIEKLAPELPRERTKPASDLKLIFIKGCTRKSPTACRDDLSKNGFESFLAKDITFLTEDIVQIMTYADKVEGLVSAIKKANKNAAQLKDFDPTAPASYNMQHQSRDSVANAYYKTLTASISRLAGCVRTAPSLTRSLNFLKKVVETRNPNYASQTADEPRGPSVTLFSSFFEMSLKQAQRPLDSEMTQAPYAQ